ncbi:hypothetical protein ACLOJK_015945 [Asimina triloba]
MHHLPNFFHHSNLPIFFFLLLPHLSAAPPPHILPGGSSLSVDTPTHILTSPDHTFAAGFRSVGQNAFCFAVWFLQPKTFTPVWMANRDRPINGKKSSLSLRSDGNLLLLDAGRSPIWATNTTSKSPTQLLLSNDGNLLLQTTAHNHTLWQSFDSPTNTLLPNQLFTRNTKLTSARSQTNFSSGFYSFFFDNDNILKLQYNGPDSTSTIYWPDPGVVSWNAGRNSFNAGRIAVLDASGQFQSTDKLAFSAWDVGFGPKRRLTLDSDGNLRLYSLDENHLRWETSWQATSSSCRIHGVCGPNSVCSYSTLGRRCSCLPGFKARDLADWTRGCEPVFDLPCDNAAVAPKELDFVQLRHVDFFGYDMENADLNITFAECEGKCLNSCSCRAFMFRFNHTAGIWACYLKVQLLNGVNLPWLYAVSYVKIPKNFSCLTQNSPVEMGLKCSPDSRVQQLPWTSPKGQEHGISSLKISILILGVIGIVEIACIFVGWWVFFRDENSMNIMDTSAAGFKRFSYAELKKATSNFSEVIGEGSCGKVYKGVLADQQVAAIKWLEGMNDQSEGQFLAEVSMIGRINHMNLIRMLGFCAQGKHRLLVYEHMEKGSLAENISSNDLDWEKRFQIAQGTAKGLAYLHEECLEWVLHCDIKPENILLDADYRPRVGDFGLSKLLDRGGALRERWVFSRMRGTRGYMAPEWIRNQPITSKVDVYSYGVVVLEMVVGRKRVREMGGDWNGRLVPWVRNVMMMGDGGGGVEELMDGEMEYDVERVERLVRVALQCVQEETDARPTMRQVVEMLSSHQI